MKTQTTRTEKAADILEAAAVGGLCASFCQLVAQFILMFF